MNVFYNLLLSYHKFDLSAFSFTWLCSVFNLLDISKFYLNSNFKLLRLKFHLKSGNLVRKCCNDKNMNGVECRVSVDSNDMVTESDVLVHTTLIRPCSDFESNTHCGKGWAKNIRRRKLLLLLTTVKKSWFQVQD